MISRWKMGIFAGSLLMTVLAVAQEPALPGDEQTDMDTIEAELQKSRPVEPSKAASERRSGGVQKPEKISDLGKLSPFSEISVIQRRFLPKTERFQFNIGLSTVANDPWFFGTGIGGRFGYSFKENLALELSYAFMGTSPKDSVKDLKTENSVNTDSIVTLKSLVGIHGVWSPIYGKLSLFNKRIVPFDMYFAGGIGTAGLTNARSSSTTAFHVGTGQIFAMSKSVGLRWDLSFNFFTATPNPTVDPLTGLTSNPSAGSFNTALLMIGASFFFPEAKYR